MKIEIVHDSYGDTISLASCPPAHRTPLHFWGDSDGVQYPYVVEVSEEVGQRIMKAFEEYRWAKKQLRELIFNLPIPEKCGCGNCGV